MADAAAAGDEDHGGRADGGHEEGIVIGAADHSFGGDVEVAAAFKSVFNEVRVANRRLVDVESLDLEFDTATGTDLGGSLFDFLESLIASLDLRIAQVDFEPGAMGDAVHGAGFDAKDAGGPDSIGAAAGFCGGFHGEGDFSSGEQGILTVGHEHRPGMTADAGELKAQCAGRGDFFDHADRNIFPFEQRPLLDVQFEKAGVAVFR